jgi:hypothetical protein
MTAILQVWMSTSKPQIDVGRRQLAVLVTKSVGTDFILRYRCLNEIATGTQCVESGTFTKALVGVLSKSETEMSQAIIELTDLLAAKEITTLCWKDLVYMRLEKQCQPGVPKGKTVLEHSLQTMKTAQWLAFMDRLEALFADQPASNPIRRPTPSILVNELIDCKTLMSKYLPTLMRLEAVIGDTPGPVRYVLGSKSWVDNLAEILGYLRLVEGKPVEVLMQRLVAKLRVDKRTDQAVKEALLNLIRASSEVADACSKIWDAKHGLICISDLPVPRQPIDDGPADVANSTGLRGANPAVVSSVLTNTPPLQRHVPPSVVEVMVAGWLQRVDIGYKNRKAIRSVADLLGIDTKARSSGAWTDKLREATAFWEGIANEIVEEANRLEILQRALRAKDPKGTVLLLQELGMPYNSFLDEEIMNLPLELMDSVERVADDGVEINFPLTAFTELQRSAMGIPRTSYSLILRLTQYDSEVASPSFCIHFNNDADLDTLMHSPWRCTPGSRPPHELVCSTPQTALVWQLSRILHTRLKAANIGISDLHAQNPPPPLHALRPPRLRPPLVRAPARCPDSRDPHRHVRRRRDADGRLRSRAVRPPRAAPRMSHPQHRRHHDDSERAAQRHSAQPRGQPVGGATLAPRRRREVGLVGVRATQGVYRQRDGIVQGAQYAAGHASVCAGEREAGHREGVCESAHAAGGADDGAVPRHKDGSPPCDSVPGPESLLRHRAAAHRRRARKGNLYGGRARDQSDVCAYEYELVQKRTRGYEGCVGVRGQGAREVGECGDSCDY